MTILVLKAETQPFRFSCKLTLEDEDQLRAYLRDPKPHNVVIEAADLWCVFVAPNGAQILIKQAQPPKETI